MSSLEFTIDEESPQVIQPKNITIPLKPHQLAMIRTMLDLEEKEDLEIMGSEFDGEIRTFQTDFGALCDKVGSGKSLIVLGLIAHKKLVPIKKKCISSYGSIIREYSLYKYNLPINMLVVPHSIINQWKNYLVKQTNLTFDIINLTNDLNNFENLIEDYKETGSIEDLNKDLILVTCTLYNKIATILKAVSINRLFIDEVETIKVPASKLVRAEFTWFISSSIKILQNPKGVYEWENYEYSNYLGYVYTDTRRVLKERMPHIGFFKTTLSNVSEINFRNQVYLRCQEEFVKQSFLLPDINFKIIKCKDTIYSHVLNGMVNAEVMNMINAGDIVGAIEQSGYECEDGTGIVKTLTKGIEKKLHNKKIDLAGREQWEYSNEEVREKSLKKIRDEIKDLEDKIECIKKRVLETEACPICYDTIQNKVIVTCCNNPFCYECIMLSLNVKCDCPLCRKKIEKSDIIVVKENDEETEFLEEEFDIEDDSSRTKKENIQKYLEEIMESDGKKKILIFSEYESSLQEIQPFLNNKNYKYNFLKGTSSKISKTVEKYKGNKLDILLLNSKYFGSGINLENTTHIFIYHKMKDHLEKQVIGRAQRPGRVGELTVYKLCYNNEINEV